MLVYVRLGCPAVVSVKVCASSKRLRSTVAAAPLSGAPRWKWASDGKAVIYSAKSSARVFLMKRSLAGGAPTEVAGFEADELFDFGYSFDKQSLAVTRGGWQHDVVLISGFARL